MERIFEQGGFSDLEKAYLRLCLPGNEAAKMVAEAEAGNLKNIENTLALKLQNSGDVGDSLMAKVATVGKNRKATSCNQVAVAGLKMLNAPPAKKRK